MMDDQLMQRVSFGFGAILTAHVAARVDGAPRTALLKRSVESLAVTGFERDELEYMLALAIDQLAERVIEQREAS